jgi:hypothetical protein
MDILVGSVFAGLADATPALAAIAGLPDVVLAAFAVLATLGLAAVLAGALVVFAPGALAAAGLLAAGLLAGTEVPADFDGVGVTAFTGCCPGFGLAAVFCEDDGANLSLIFCRKDVCADALPTNVMVISS